MELCTGSIAGNKRGDTRRILSEHQEQQQYRQQQTPKPQTEKEAKTAATTNDTEKCPDNHSDQGVTDLHGGRRIVSFQ